jgi:hypothetical protein
MYKRWGFPIMILLGICVVTACSSAQADKCREVNSMYIDMDAKYTTTFDSITASNLAAGIDLPSNGERQGVVLDENGDADWDATSYRNLNANPEWPAQRSAQAALLDSAAKIWPNITNEDIKSLVKNLANFESSDPNRQDPRDTTDWKTLNAVCPWDAAFTPAS